ncbi:ABC transporter permease [Paenibacillus endoradicis]|uniref:ABC transporter permease n=1 Tax=Paenibacillus endoradicis TaxID=2972487 RepID=UPI002158FB7E|nr:FtsX-like permease family protein [Paenibacillus endoradicis]MCR8659450.1 FtsX-like permease family protein [Paenibacillus endoradicis]
MNGWKYIWNNMRYRSLLSALTIFAVMITVALFVLLLISKDSVEHGAQKGYGPFELVIGADGSDSQLVLNTFYRVGVPTGNIPLELLSTIEKSEHTDVAYGLTTGDNYNGYPIVGVSPAYFATRYEDRHLEAGHLYAALGEVTVGYAVAKELGMHIGDQFSGAHGLVEHVDLDHESNEKDEHNSFHYKVVGILPKLNTADDRTVFTRLEYAWAVHNDDDSAKEITSIIVKPLSLVGIQSLKQQFDTLDNVQAVYSSKAVADVLNVVDTGSQLLMIVMSICVLLAMAALLLALTASIQERKRDVGLLRLIGKSKVYILSTLIAEGMALATIGLIAGLILGHIVGVVISDSLFIQTGVQLQAFQIATYEWLLIIATLSLALLASLGPALKVYRTDAITLFRN